MSGMGRNPIRDPIADALNFLAELFEQGYQYPLLNTYRSAIFMVHEKIDDVEVGKHPLVSRMLKEHLISMIPFGMWIRC